MALRRFSLALGLALLATSAFACGGGKKEALPEETLTADSQIASPDLLLKIEGDFSKPERNRFTYTAGIGGTSATQEVVILGDRAYVKDKKEVWQEMLTSDQDLQGALNMSLGRKEFWAGTDMSDLEQLPFTREKANGVVARRYSISDANAAKVPSIFGDIPSDIPFQATFWVAEDGGWLMGMRWLIEFDRKYLEGNSRGLEDDDPVPANAPINVLSTFHYTAMMAGQLNGRSVRVEVIYLISRANDKSIKITRPQ